MNHPSDRRWTWPLVIAVAVALMSPALAAAAPADTPPATSMPAPPPANAEPPEAAAPVEPEPMDPEPPDVVVPPPPMPPDAAFPDTGPAEAPPPDAKPPADAAPPAAKTADTGPAEKAPAAEPTPATPGNAAPTAAKTADTGAAEKSAATEPTPAARSPATPGNAAPPAPRTEDTRSADRGPPPTAADLKAATNAKPGTWDAYRLLAQRNIFVRDRRLPRTDRRSPTRPEAAADAARDADRQVVLTGITRQGDEFVAFFENLRTGKTLRVPAGAAVGAGTLRTIGLNAVQYERGGETARITIGYSLAGALATLPTKVPPKAEVKTETKPEVAAAPSPTGPAPAMGAPGAMVPAVQASGAMIVPGTNGAITIQVAPSAAEPAPPGGVLDPDTASILERMRQRREQELRQ